MRRDHTDVEVTKRLAVIESGIIDLTQSLRARQDSSIASAPEAELQLKQFLDAATTFKTNASTVVGGSSTVRGGPGIQYDESIFGDVLSGDQYEIIQSWIPPPSTVEASVSTPGAGGNQRAAFSRQSSLPDLMTMLQSVTQMADQYRSFEEERTSSRDEQIRDLEAKKKALVERLKAARSESVSTNLERLRCLQTLAAMEGTLANAEKVSNVLGAQLREKEAANRSLRAGWKELENKCSERERLLDAQGEKALTLISDKVKLQVQIRLLSSSYAAEQESKRKELDHANARITELEESEKQRTSEHELMKRDLELKISKGEEQQKRFEAEYSRFNTMAADFDRESKAIRHKNKNLGTLMSRYSKLHQQQGELLSEFTGGPKDPEESKSPSSPRRKKEDESSTPDAEVTKPSIADKQRRLSTSKMIKGDKSSVIDVEATSNQDAEQQESPSPGAAAYEIYKKAALKNALKLSAANVESTIPLALRVPRRG